MILIYVCTMNVIFALLLASLVEALPCPQNETSRTITSPNYPDNYPNNVHCVSPISAPKAHVVQLKIEYFQLADSSPSCNDYFKVLDGSVEESENQIYYRCGSNTTWQNVIQSTIHDMTVIFASDGSNTAKGFTARYSYTPYEEEFMLLADHTDREIIKLDILRGWSNTIPFQKQPNGRLVGKMEFDPVTEQIYFTDEENKTLWRINIDGSGDELLIEGERQVGGLALNSRSRNLYYIAGHDIIAARMDGTVRYQIGKGSKRTKDVTTDYISSYVFWATGDNTAARIIRSDGDGGNVIYFTGKDLGDPRGLTVHYSGDGAITVYVCDHLQSAIRRFSVDGKDMGTVQPEGSMKKPSSVALDSLGSVYWTATNSYGLQVLKSNGEHIVDDNILQKKRNLTDIVIYSSTVSTPEQCHDECDIDSLCLPVPLSLHRCVSVLPTIRECPANIYESTETTSAEVWWNEPIAQWPRGTSETVYKSHAPGSLFDLGTTKVEYIFTDELGNTAECAFTVTVTRTSSKGAGDIWRPISIVVIVLLLLVIALLVGGICRLVGGRQRNDGHEPVHGGGAGEPDQGNIEEHNERAPILRAMHGGGMYVNGRDNLAQADDGGAGEQDQRKMAQTDWKLAELFSSPTSHLGMRGLSPVTPLHEY